MIGYLFYSDPVYLQVKRDHPIYLLGKRYNDMILYKPGSNK